MDKIAHHAVVIYARAGVNNHVLTDASICIDDCTRKDHGPQTERHGVFYCCAGMNQRWSRCTRHGGGNLSAQVVATDSDHKPRIRVPGQQPSNLGATTQNAKSADVQACQGGIVIEKAQKLCAGAFGTVDNDLGVAASAENPDFLSFHDRS
jgi:hypothetical protein